MVFTPPAGLWAVEHFDGTGFGHNPTAPNQQNVVDGHVTLIPQVQTSTSFVKGWTPVSGWNINNGLHSRTQIESVFTISGGVYDPTFESGSQSVLFGAGAYQIHTPMLTRSGQGWSGQAWETVISMSGSPDESWFVNFSGTLRPVTIEVDVAATHNLYSGVALAGFGTGQALSTGLAALTGIVGHGLYLNDGTNWDYLELSPYGIRSLNHPELALPVNLAQPHRLRIGIENTDIYILSDEGKGVAGLGKFDTDIRQKDDEGARFAFGAPPTGQYWNFSGIDGFVGTTVWDNIKIRTGELILEVPTGVKQIYPTGLRTFYPNVYNPQLALTRYVSAEVGFRHYHGGETTITPQWSGFTGWVDLAGGTKKLVVSENPARINLKNLPIFNGGNYPTGAAPQQIRASNPIRFKIDQISLSGGSSPAPAVDYIKVVADNNTSYLDMMPNWKPLNQEALVQFAVKHKDFYSSDLIANQYMTFLLNSPGTGQQTASGTFPDSSLHSATGSIVGTGEWVPGGPFGNAFQTYQFISGKAQSGSVASVHFGTQAQSNYFPYGEINSFTQVAQITGFQTGAVFGEIAAGMSIPTSYTGVGTLRYSKRKVFKPVQQSTFAKQAGFMGYGATTLTNYAQNVLVQGSQGKKECGIEIEIPQGIAFTGKHLFSCDLEIAVGTGLDVWVSGGGIGPDHFLAGDSFRNFRRISLPFMTASSGRHMVGLTAPTGTVDFTIDNVSYSPYTDAYILASGITGGGDHTGAFDLGTRTFEYLSGHPSAKRASTAVHGWVRLDSYPTGDNVLVEKRDHINLRGFTLSINTGGYLVADCDLSHEAFSTGLNTPAVRQNLPKHIVTGESRFPLGRWAHFGFMHQVHCYHGLGYAGYSGQRMPANFASSNRGILTVDGRLDANKDFMSYWTGVLDGPRFMQTGKMSDIVTDIAPWASFIPDDSGRLVIGSGMFAQLDAVTIDRRPVASAENVLSIEGARVSAPYFVPHGMVHPGNKNHERNRLFTGQFDLGFHSSYSFGGPGHTNWDHGPAGNHLMFYGNASKVMDSPYPNWSSTHFPSGSYAKANYSSSIDRVAATTGNYNIWLTGITFRDEWKFSSDTAYWAIGGWVKPMSTGIFFQMAEDENNLAGSGVLFGMSGSADNGYFFVAKRGVNTPAAFYPAPTSPFIWEATQSAKYTTGPITTGNWYHVFFVAWLHGSSFPPGTTELSIEQFNAAQCSLYVTGELDGVTPATIGNGVGYSYLGAEGSPRTSSMVFGTEADCQLSDWFITNTSEYGVFGNQEHTILDGTFYTNAGRRRTISKPERTGVDVGAEYNLLFKGGKSYSGALTGSVVYFDGHGTGRIYLPNNSNAGEYPIWAATNGYSTYEHPSAGFALYEKTLFREAQAYQVVIDDSSLVSAFGDTSSPIRMGYAVPQEAVQIARIDSPELTVQSSINTLDLADRNPHNLASYRMGRYTVGRNSGEIASTEASGSYKGINSGVYSGRADVVFSGQVTTDNVEVTSLSVSDLTLSEPYEAYYYYLIGRGEWAVQIPDAFPHDTGVLTQYATGAAGLTGQSLDNYTANLERLKSHINLKTTEGKDISLETYPWDIVTSPFTPDDLEFAAKSGLDIELEGLGTGEYTGMLPDGTFTVALLTSRKILGPGETVWVHYPGYNTVTQAIDINRSEVVNASPIMRKNLDFEKAQAGRYSLELDNIDHENYNVTVYGVHSGYSGLF